MAAKYSFFLTVKVALSGSGVFIYMLGRHWSARSFHPGQDPPVDNWQRTVDFNYLCSFGKR
jgi:hypothetical protein